MTSLIMLTYVCHNSDGTVFKKRGKKFYLKLKC